MPHLPKPTLPQLLRLIYLLLITLLSLLVVLVGLSQILCPLLLHLAPSLSPLFYDLGLWGPYRTTSYTTFAIPSPHFSTPAWSPSCAADNRLIFLTPKGSWVPQGGGPMLVHPTGELVWSAAAAGSWRNAMNLDLQTYKGEKFLTFWTGDKAATSGQGVYVMLDAAYEKRYEVKPDGVGLHADLHEFQITREGTGLLTIYNRTVVEEMDFIMGGKQRGWLTESAFQEVDIETGERLFEWRAAEHYELGDSYYWAPFGGWSADQAFDWFHINSIAKDSKGDYLISSRHLHMVASIDGKSGKPLWTLGGKKNDFKDMSDGKATNFQWQHDARWVDEEKGIISLYDNGYAGPVQSASPHSRAIVVQIDREAMTVKLLHEYSSLRHARAASQGSVQVLEPEGNVFVGWGHVASVSEYRESGELLCEWHFSPSIFDFPDFVASYRARKHRGWVGKPKTKPSAAIKGGKLYVSWNGATEVASWSLQATRMYATKLEKGQAAEEEGEYEEIDVITPSGFESVFPLPDNFLDHFTSVRVAALDKDGELLEFSTAAEVLEESSLWQSLFMVVLCVGFVVGSGIFFVKVVRKQNLGLPALPLAWQEWSKEKFAGLEKWNPWSVYHGYRKLG